MPIKAIGYQNRNLPSIQACPPGPACTDGHEQENVACMEKPASVDLVQEQRNRGSCGICVRLQVRLYSGIRHVEYLGDALEDTGGRLVRNDHRDVFKSQPVDAENLPNTLGYRGCSLLLKRFSVHCEVGVPGVDREMVHALALGEENARKEPILPIFSLEYHGTGTVSENDAVA